MLCSIDHRFRAEAFVLIRWIAYAREPLCLDQLAEALVIKEDGNVEMTDRGSPQDTIDILAGLITIEETKSIEGPASSASDHIGGVESVERSRTQVQPSPRVSFAHYSVKEYLESQRIKQSGARQFSLEKGDGHRLLSQSCLAYLFHYSHSNRMATREDLRTFPLLEYAAKFWDRHSRLQQPSEFSREMRLLRSYMYRRDWLMIWAPDYSIFYAMFGRSGMVGCDLYYASYLGLDELVIALLQSGSNPNADGAIFDKALHVATLTEDKKIVGLLLDGGADINAKSLDGYTALQVASSIDNEEVRSLLLDRGAAIDPHGRQKANIFPDGSGQYLKDLINNESFRSRSQAFRSKRQSSRSKK